MDLPQNGKSRPPIPPLKQPCAAYRITFVRMEKIPIFTWACGKFLPPLIIYSTPTPSCMKIPLLSLIAILSVTSFLAAQPSPESARNPDPVASDVYVWNAFKPDDKKNREKKDILQGSTKFLETLEIHTSTLEPKASAGPAHTHDDLEELVIVKEGTLKVTQKDKIRILGPGSIALTLPGDLHRLENGGDTPVTYYLMTYRSVAPPNADRGKKSGGSLMIDRESIGFTRHGKGGIRRYFDRPTTMFERMEMHVTTLNEGLKSHDPHTHRADEIVLIISGKTEMQIDRDRIGATAGSLVFLNSMVPHALTNTGSGPCEYFAFQWE